MIYSPHDYQRYAIDYILEHPIAAVFLDMGLGKTSITLTALEQLLFDRFEAHRVLIIAPLRVARDTWPDELKKWDHLRQIQMSVVVGSAEERMAALKQQADLYVINRENVKWLIEESGQRFDFDTVVIDELSSFKSYQAKRFRALMKVRPRVRRIIALTGTPSSNGLMDLWAEFRLLDMGQRLGRYIGDYRARYFTPDKRNGMQVFSYRPLPGADKVIYDRIGDITISMRSTDHLKMPPLMFNTVRVSMTPAEQDVYDQLRQDMVVTLGDREIDAVNAAALTGKLLQMANGAVYDDAGVATHIHDHKLEALEDLVEAANGKPVLVAYWFKHDLDRIRAHFAVREIKSSRDIADWNAGKIPVAVIHPASAGHGLNLQAGGCTLVWFGLTWSLELYQQTNARLWRQGQTNTVVIHHIITGGTIDESVLQALRQKEKVQNSLINAVKAQLEVKG